MRLTVSKLALYALVAGACVPFDSLGEEEIVKEASSASPPVDPIADDDIADKHPVYDDSLTIDETFGPCTATLNKSGSVTKLDIVPFDPGDPTDGALYPTFPAALAAVGAGPTLPSMELVNAKLKPFDDGLYAAVEMGAEDGSDGSAIAKRRLFHDLLAALVDRAKNGAAYETGPANEAATQIAAAASLGGIDVSDVAAPDASSLLATFANDALHSKPIGFYTWNSELSAIFEQDRFLQSPDSVRPSFGAFAAMAAVLSANGDLAGRYGNVLDLYAGLTNPYVDHPVRDLMPFVPGPPALANVDGVQSAFFAAYPDVTTGADAACVTHLALVPASTSPEARFVRQAVCSGAVDPSANLLDALITAIRSGAIDLTPTEASGWYDRQLYALETLLVPDKAPEKDHLFLTKRYKEKLVETFKTIITETRETHVKQVETTETDDTSAPTSRPVHFSVYPLLPAEPFPTFYLRTARAYAFLDGLLRSTIGADFLSKSHRLLQDGTRASPSLGDELHAITQLVYGLHVVASGSIGMRHQMTDDEVALFPPDDADRAARNWLASAATDPDVAYDPRVIVPVSHDQCTAMTTYWAVVGVRAWRANAVFYPGYEPKLVKATGNSEVDCIFDGFVDRTSYLLGGQQVEVKLPDSVPPPTRDEFRATCDRAKTPDAIVAALGGR